MTDYSNGWITTPMYPNNFSGLCSFYLPPQRNQSIMFTVAGDNTEGDEVYMLHEAQPNAPILISRGHQKAGTVYVPLGMGLRMIFSKPRAVLISNYDLDNTSFWCPFPIINVSNTSLQLNLTTFPGTGCAFRLLSDKNISMATSCAVAYVYRPGNSTRLLLYDPSVDTDLHGEPMKIVLEPKLDILLVSKNVHNCTVDISPADSFHHCDRGTITLLMSYKRLPWESTIGLRYNEEIFPSHLFPFCPQITAHFKMFCTDCSTYAKDGQHFGITATVYVGKNCEVVISNETTELIRFTQARILRNRLFLPGHNFELEVTCQQMSSAFDGYSTSFRFDHMFNDCVCPPLFLEDSSKGLNFTGMPHCSILPYGMHCYSRILPKNKKRRVEITYHFLDDEDLLYIVTPNESHELTSYTQEELDRYDYELRKSEQPVDKPPKKLTIHLQQNETLTVQYTRDATGVYKDPIRFPGVFNITWHDVD